MYNINHDHDINEIPTKFGFSLFPNICINFKMPGFTRVSTVHSYFTGKLAIIQKKKIFEQEKEYNIKIIIYRITFSMHQLLPMNEDEEEGSVGGTRKKKNERIISSNENKSSAIVLTFIGNIL